MNASYTIYYGIVEDAFTRFLRPSGAVGVVLEPSSPGVLQTAVVHIIKCEDFTYTHSMPQVTVIEDSAISVSPFSDNDLATVTTLAAALRGTPNYDLGNCWPAYEAGFKQALQQTAEHLHVLKDYLAYEEVRGRTGTNLLRLQSLLKPTANSLALQIVRAQPSWRPFIWKSAIDLVQQSGELTGESFHRAVLCISHKVLLSGAAAFAQSYSWRQS